MHVAVDLNLNWFLQFIVTVFIVALGLHRLVKNTASKYFVVDASFDSSSSSSSPAAGADTLSFKTGSADNCCNNNNNKEKNMAEAGGSCAVCGNFAKKKCSRCKMVNYCSEACQRSHWQSEHKTKCMKPQSSGKANIKHSSSTWQGSKASSAISLVPCTGISKILNQSKKILFPYEEFVELFNWNSSGFPPCGLLNCGNSCFANVVLQCLAYTKPLVAYLLEKGHRRECRRNDWCFLCEFQIHLEKASQSLHPFSPINILSRLPNIGGNLGYGSQEDAHEFMRFAIDTMQSVCLDEFGGEKAVHPSSQETTLIQHIFGGRLQSQVICTKCNSISDQLENMMDLTVEIQGDAASLEKCLDQFTAKEWLHGENMYKCDRCNDYVTAWKCLTIQSPPNILTIALKRFQGGRFGKLNKRVTFPETLDLSPYVSKPGDDNDIYKLYAVIVHVDMLNASFFGHYICYIKDFCGNWYRIDDCKVARVDVDEVLSQGAYMLLYSRVSPRATCLYPFESEREGIKKNVLETEELQPSPEQNAQCPSAAECHNSATDSCVQRSTKSPVTKITSSEEDFTCVTSSEDVKERIHMVDSGRVSSDIKDVIDSDGGSVLFRRPQSGDTSSTCKFSTEADVVKLEQTSHISGVEDESGRMKTSHCNRYPSNNDLSFTQNGVCGKVETPSDLSTCSVEPVPMLASSGHTQNGAVKSEGTYCSGPKLKPLFSPGFLVKCTRNKSEMKNLEVSEGHCERAYDTMLCGPSSEFASSDSFRQNGVITDEDKPYFGYQDEWSFNILNKQAEDLHHLRFNESAEANLHNGEDSGSPIASNESINISNTDDREMVPEENLSLNGRCDG